MAGAMLSMSDSVHASVIIHNQLQKQLREQQEAGSPRPLGAESEGNKQHLHQTQEHEEAGQERRVGICVQLMLVSALFGIEMCMSFEQIYEILFLQFLGVPLALVSVNGILAGCVSMVFLPVVGAWADGGDNPKTRKLFSLFGGLAVFVVGLLLLVIASLIKIQQLGDITGDLSSPNTSTLNTLIPRLPLEITGEIATNKLNNITDQHNADIGPKFSFHPSPTSSLMSVDNPNTEEPILNYASLPGIVFISILGFAGLDIGFDVTVSLSRALILENVPSFQHMRVLVLATIVQSFAGTSCSLIGCFDLPGMLGTIFSTDGTAATLMFFCCVLLVATLVGFLLMSIASFILGKKKDQPSTSKTLQLRCPKVNNVTNSSHIHSASVSCSTNAKVSISQSEESEAEKNKPLLVLNKHREVKRKLQVGQLQQLHEERPYIPDILHTEEGDTSTKPLLLEDSLKVNYSALNTAILPLALDDRQNSLHQYQGTNVISADDTYTPGHSMDANVASSDAEKAVERSTSTPSRTIQQRPSFDGAGVSTVLTAIRQSYSMSMSQRGALGVGDFHARKLKQLRQAQSKLSSHEKAEKLKKMRKKLAILCVSSFLTIGASISYSVYSSNTLNLGILHGDPTALPGTEGRENYERGLQLGAVGSFIMYCSFMAVSLGNTKIIETIGERGQFMLFHVLQIVALVTLITTRRVEVYFIFMVFGGAFRTCMLTLPFVLAHKFTQEGMDTDPLDPEQKVSQAGRVMTLIGFLIPTHYMILSIVMGPLLEALGNPWVPLFYSLAASSLSLGVFSLLFFV